MEDNRNRLTRIGGLAIRAPQRFFAGLALVAVCLFVLWANADLDQGTVRMMGPAMFPRILAVLLGLSGVALFVLSFWVDGDPLERWSLRGPFFVTIAILSFAVTIRSLGLAVAAMLALILSGFATPEARIREIIIFSLVMTAASILLFRYFLEMSVSILIIPGTGIEL